MRRLLVSVDNSDVCEEAVKWVMANLWKEADEVHLLHVVPRLQVRWVGRWVGGTLPIA